MAVRMVDKMHMKVGQRVAICGGGPIGLLVLQLVKALRRDGADDDKAHRGAARAVKKRFGAKHTIDPAKQNVVEEGNKITNGYGFDVVLDASGFPGALEALLDIAAKGGTVIYGAMYPTQYALPLNLNDYLYNKELTPYGQLHLPVYAFPRALQLLEELDLEPFTEAVFPHRPRCGSLCRTGEGTLSQDTHRMQSGHEAGVSRAMKDRIKAKAAVIYEKERRIQHRTGNAESGKAGRAAREDPCRRRMPHRRRSACGKLRPAYAGRSRP